jgi:hypothetical protein
MTTLKLVGAYGRLTEYEPAHIVDSACGASPGQSGFHFRNANGTWSLVAGGGGGDVSYTHNQATPAIQWAINHGLGKFPSVTVVDSSGAQVEGDVEYVDANNVLATFAGAFSGVAYLN